MKAESRAFAAFSVSLWLILGLSLLLAACGFKLRGAQQLPFETIYLGFGPNSSLGAELARNIRAGTSTRVVDDRAQAQAVLDVLGEARERDVLSVSAQGRAREFQLRLRLQFRLHDGKGREFIAPTQITVQRDISFNEAQVLAKESEEALLYRDMQTDVVQQLLRRLAAVKVDAAKG
ncbi:MAG: LPS assembly lipoprotein LptE [Burkholderiaceae bacterium]|nr:LPS assembly lipoprotein LptE [Burkholderiaceae bacterium]